MKKRITKRSNKKNSTSYPIVSHLKTLLFSAIVGIVVFIGSSYFFSLRLTCANSHTCESDLSTHIDNDMIGLFQGHQVIPPKINLALEILALKPSILGTTVTKEEKHIYIDLTTQILYAYEGNTQIFKTFISSGKWGKTPVGNFHIWTKLRATRMSGGTGADAYNLPNVPYVMYFYHDFGLHGAYWHNNYGHPMSHGCINMRIVDAETLYTWADAPTTGQLGTAVSTCDSFITPNTCIQTNPINQ